MTAEISTQPSVLRELYGSSDDTWFDGVDDPSLTASVSPSQVFYWDPKSNMLVPLFKLGVDALTGSQPDLMDQGQLKV